MKRNVQNSTDSNLPTRQPLCFTPSRPLTKAKDLRKLLADDPDGFEDDIAGSETSSVTSDLNPTSLSRFTVKLEGRSRDPFSSNVLSLDLANTAFLSSSAHAHSTLTQRGTRPGKGLVFAAVPSEITLPSLSHRSGLSANESIGPGQQNQKAFMTYDSPRPTPPQAPRMDGMVSARRPVPNASADSLKKSFDKTLGEVSNLVQTASHLSHQMADPNQKSLNPHEHVHTSEHDSTSDGESMQSAGLMQKTIMTAKERLELRLRQLSEDPVAQEALQAWAAEEAQKKKALIDNRIILRNKQTVSMWTPSTRQTLRSEGSAVRQSRAEENQKRRLAIQNEVMERCIYLAETLQEERREASRVIEEQLRVEEETKERARTWAPITLFAVSTWAFARMFEEWLELKRQVRAVDIIQRALHRHMLRVRAKRKRLAMQKFRKHKNVFFNYIMKKRREKSIVVVQDMLYNLKFMKGMKELIHHFVSRVVRVQRIIRRYLRVRRYRIQLLMLQYDEMEFRLFNPHAFRLQPVPPPARPAGSEKRPTPPTTAAPPQPPTEKSNKPPAGAAAGKPGPKSSKQGGGPKQPAQEGGGGGGDGRQMKKFWDEFLGSTSRTCPMGVISTFSDFHTLLSKFTKYAEQPSCEATKPSMSRDVQTYIVLHKTPFTVKYKVLSDYVTQKRRQFLLDNAAYRKNMSQYFQIMKSRSILSNDGSDSDLHKLIGQVARPDEPKLFYLMLDKDMENLCHDVLTQLRTEVTRVEQSARAQFSREHDVRLVAEQWVHKNLASDAQLAQKLFGNGKHLWAPTPPKSAGASSRPSRRNSGNS